MNKKIILVSFILILCGCSDNSIKTNEIIIKAIDTKTVYQELDNKKVYIIDVREEYEYKSGHIKNAYNIPLTKINEISKLMLSLDSKIIVYCHSGNRSRKAANSLIDMGYTNVYDMGGINDWNYELIKE